MYVKVTCTDQNKQAVPIEIVTMIVGRIYSPTGEQRSMALGVGSKSAWRPIQHGRTRVHEEIFRRPDGTPAPRWA